MPQENLGVPFKWKNILIALAILILGGSIVYAANRRYKVRHTKPSPTVVDHRYIKKPATGKVYRKSFGLKKKLPKKSTTCTCDTLIFVLQ